MNDKYKVVFVWEHYAFEEEVNALIKKGWTPQGGVSIVEKGSHLGYAQAMLFTAQSECEEI